MLAAIKWNSRYSAREWVMMAGLLVLQLRTLNANRHNGESKPRRPLWKDFDDTHHWDSTAEEWVPNKIGDSATWGLAARIPRHTFVMGALSGRVPNK
ncbi:hypothetical protein ABIB68_007038 [Bradyrhizobium sp. F1.2.2]